MSMARQAATAILTGDGTVGRNPVPATDWSRAREASDQKHARARDSVGKIKIKTPARRGGRRPPTTTDEILDTSRYLYTCPLATRTRE